MNISTFDELKKGFIEKPDIFSIQKKSLNYIIEKTYGINMAFIFENIDLFIFLISCLILFIYLLKYLQSRNNSSDDEDGKGDGGQLNAPNDPVLDLPPGVTLPTDTTEPELV